MDSMMHIVMMWEEEGAIVLLAFLGLILFYYLGKLWGAPGEAVFGIILGASLGVAAAAIFLTRHIWGFALSHRAFWFIALYMWCVVVMLFYAARNTHCFKLFLALAAQGGIVYALFVLL